MSALARLRRLACASVAAAFALVTLPAAAQDDLESLRGLLDEPVVTSASQTAETAATAPATSSTLTADDMRRYGIRSLDEAINYLSLGAIATNPLGPYSNTAEVGSRGVLLTNDHGAHLLLLVDGHHLNEPFFGSARYDRGLGVPFELIDHIDVILGPGSVLYGSNAMLGVINVVTKRAKDFAGAHLVAETEIAASYRAAAGVGTTFELFGKPAEATVGLEYFRRFGPVFHVGPQDLGIDSLSGKPARVSRNGEATGIWGGPLGHSVYANVPSAYGRLRVGELELSINASSFKHGKPLASLDFDDPRSSDRDRRLWGDLSYDTALSRRVRLRTRVYADSFDYESHNLFSRRMLCGITGANVCDGYLGVVSRWVGLETQVSVDWYQDGRLTTLVGADGRISYWGRKTELLEDVTGAVLLPTHDYSHEYDELLGVYAQNVWKPHSTFDLNVGARADARPGFTTVVNPRAAANLRPWAGGTLKLIYAEAFRSPTWFERKESYLLQAGSNDLRPETVASAEASIEQRFGAQKALFGVFRTQWKDTIDYHLMSQPEIDRAVATGELSVARDPGTIGQHRNLSTILNYGFNASYEGSLVDGRLRYGIAVTGAYARRSEPTVDALPLPVVPHAYGNARVSYELRNGWPTLALAARYTGPRPADRAFTVPFHPTPYVNSAVTLRATATGEMPYLPRLSYRLSAEVAPHQRAPYVAGPIDTPTASHPWAELAPVDPFRAAVGLQYDF